ncbi:MAG: TrbC/VirB2 family protein [Candidatus Portnoybacteria bacterium]|nr:TrbC/VirB2 family protein [Candidatus Portnoybacteria bacterium]MDD4982820.1 TrbC/VirB2 family protein [Candidatus Portnoybacteria bacterium]
MQKSYKTFFIAFLMIGGFFVLAEAGLAATSSGQSCGGYGDSSCPSGESCITDPDTGQGNCFLNSYGAGAGNAALPSAEPLNAGNYAPGPNSVSLPNFIGAKSVSELIIKIINFLIPLATIFAVFMLIWAGFQFATAQGNENKLTAAKKNFIWTIAGIAVIMASQAIVTYITDILGGGSGQGSALVAKIKDTLNQIIGLLFILVTVYFFWGVAEYVRYSASGESAKLEEGKRHMIWGIIGMAVMLGAWGIVQMIQLYFA